MKVLLVGGGAREHALAWAMSKSPELEALVAAPGNAGIAELGECVAVAPDDIDGLARLAEERQVDLVVIGPDAAAVGGLADALADREIPAFGPTRAAARIEGSKAWAKELCERHGIPHARARVFEDAHEAISYLETFEGPYVVKADGLALGKGVTITSRRADAEAAVRRAMVDRAFGDAGDRVVIEEFLEGPELSAFVLTDGETILPFGFARDFKRALDGDEGPNTGGMGSFSPPELGADTEAAVRAILEATVRALASEGAPYRGCLYGGLILTSEGPRVLEFNARFGDPETQAILPRLESPVLPLLWACAEGGLAGHEARWTGDACVTVVLASGGYPASYRTGLPIDGLEEAQKTDKVAVFHAGTAVRDGRVVTAGGRVLAVSALGKDLADARSRAYDAASRISFEGLHHRTDIAKEAAGG